MPSGQQMTESMGFPWPCGPSQPETSQDESEQENPGCELANLAEFQDVAALRSSLPGEVFCV